MAGELQFLLAPLALLWIGWRRPSTATFVAPAPMCLAASYVVSDGGATFCRGAATLTHPGR